MLDSTSRDCAVRVRLRDLIDAQAETGVHTHGWKEDGPLLDSYIDTRMGRDNTHYQEREIKIPWAKFKKKGRRTRAI